MFRTSGYQPKPSGKPLSNPPSTLSETPDKFHQHEALHTAHVLIRTWEEFVLYTAYMNARPEVKAKCTAALEAMAEAYQAIGQEDM